MRFNGRNLISMPAFFDEGRCECVRINKHGKREKATDRVDDDGVCCGIWEDQAKEGNSILINWTSEVSIGKYLKIQTGGNDAFLLEGVTPVMKQQRGKGKSKKPKAKLVLNKPAMKSKTRSSNDKFAQCKTIQHFINKWIEIERKTPHSVARKCMHSRAFHGLKHKFRDKSFDMNQFP